MTTRSRPRTFPEPVRVRLKRLPHAAELPLPERATPGSAGCDLRAAITSELVLAPLGRALVPTGLVLEIPAGYEGQVRPRSGLALRHGITMVNPPGTVDSDYRGELAVPLINLGTEPFVLQRGDRIAQLLILPVPAVVFEEVEELSNSGRGKGGFGSTGVG